MDRIAVILAALSFSTGEVEPASQPHGCRPIPESAIQRVQGARVHLETATFIPDDEVRVSGDDGYWICWLYGLPDALYVPARDAAPSTMTGDDEEED
jgi:hypothetical protein